MPKLISAAARFETILTHCPPGDYTLNEVEAMTGIAYSMLQHVFNNYRHPRVSSPKGIRGCRSRRVIVLPPLPPTRPWRDYRPKAHCDHKVVVIPPPSSNA